MDSNHREKRGMISLMYLFICLFINFTTSAKGYEAYGRVISRDSSVGIATKVRMGRSGFLVSETLRDLSLLRNVQTGCEAHKACYSTGTRVSVSGGQVTLI
jgi:hypothetical protein